MPLILTFFAMPSAFPPASAAHLVPWPVWSSPISVAGAPVSSVSPGTT